MAASEAELGRVHSLMAQWCTARLTDSENPVSASEMAVIRAFLKDNDITADASQNEELQAMTAALQRRKSKKLTMADLEKAAMDFVDMDGAPLQ